MRAGEAARRPAGCRYGAGGGRGERDRWDRWDRRAGAGTPHGAARRRPVNGRGPLWGSLPAPPGSGASRCFASRCPSRRRGPDLLRRRWPQLPGAAAAVLTAPCGGVCTASPLRFAFVGGRSDESWKQQQQRQRDSSETRTVLNLELLKVLRCERAPRAPVGETVMSASVLAHVLRP